MIEGGGRVLRVVEMRGCRERELSEIEPEQKRVGGAASFLERGIWSRDTFGSPV
jgi:hypothetical protein